MFCNFEEGLPGIYRLWGKAHAYEKGTPEFDAWFKKAFTEHEGFLIESGLMKAMRSIIVADIYEVRRRCRFKYGECPWSWVSSLHASQPADKALQLPHAHRMNLLVSATYHT